jgi:hypothetical protein
MMIHLIMELRHHACDPSINSALLAFSVHHTLGFSPFFSFSCYYFVVVEMWDGLRVSESNRKKILWPECHTNSFYVQALYKYVLYIRLLLVNYVWQPVRPYHDWFWPEPPHPSSPCLHDRLAYQPGRVPVTSQSLGHCNRKQDWDNWRVTIDRTNL